MRTHCQHQFIDRETREIKTETLFGDGIVSGLYSRSREKNPLLFDMLTSARLSRVLGFLSFDSPFNGSISGVKQFVEQSGIDLNECVDDPADLHKARKLFERKIRYWETRPMPEDPHIVVSPSDSRVLVGSFEDTSHLHVKEKFFSYSELFGPDKVHLRRIFNSGMFALFRLTPEKYHYNHSPVSGMVLDFYEVPGCYCPCNPSAVVEIATPYSKNKRVVTIIDTDVEGGTNVGVVAMIEIVALMIGDIVQCYSSRHYDNPRPVIAGMHLERGQVKSLFRPGSSTVLLLFQNDRIEFSEDLVTNMYHPEAMSRFSKGFGRPLVETEVAVRSPVAGKKG